MTVRLDAPARAPAAAPDPASGDAPLRSAVLETPSGKGAGDENFPVGSFLIAKRHRPTVAVFYAFARAMDDIGDNPDLTPEDKIARLDAMDRALVEPSDDPAVAKATALRVAFTDRGLPVRHGRDLISAFRQDAVKSRYADWAELVDYCDRSAAPVGRFLVDLHGEAKATHREADALSNALQVLNHLQDCQKDHREMDRVYLPQDWMAAEGATVDDLRSARATPALRRVLDRCLDGVERMMETARPLATRIADRRFAMEASTIVYLADRLADRLRTQDPIAGRVALTKLDFARAATKGVLEGWLGHRPARHARGVASAGIEA